MNEVINYFENMGVKIFELFPLTDQTDGLLMIDEHPDLFLQVGQLSGKKYIGCGKSLNGDITFRSSVEAIVKHELNFLLNENENENAESQNRKD